jgi:single stranded DNA-binding protein
LATLPKSATPSQARRSPPYRWPLAAASKTAKATANPRPESQTCTAQWHRITCFNGVGKCVAEHVTKGAMIMVTGRIHYTKWTDQNGTDRYGCEIIAEQVDFLAKAKEVSNDEPKKRRSK